MEVLDDLLCEPLVQFFLGVKQQTLALGTFFASSHQGRELIAFKQTGNFCVGEEGVHAFKETRVENISFVHDKTDLFTLAPGPAKNASQIIVEIFRRILPMHLNLEDLQTVHPRNEARQRSLTTSTNSNQDEVTLWLSEHPVNTQSMFQNVVE